eukprot:scaffold8966_cov132-Isochrysis_galbana.AAC.8
MLIGAWVSFAWGGQTAIDVINESTCTISALKVRSRMRFGLACAVGWFAARVRWPNVGVQRCG